MDESNPASRRLSRETLYNVFSGLDSDGDGRLTKEDLERVWPQGSGRLSELFDKLDVNQTGTLSFAEFLVAYENMHQGQPAESQEESPADRRLKEVFDYVDVDGDGMITLMELAMAANQVIGRALTQAELAPLRGAFGEDEGLDFDKFRSFLMDWAENMQNGQQSPDLPKNDEPESPNNDIPPAQPRRETSYRPSFIRGDSRTVISTEEGDAELIAAQHEIRLLESLVQEIRSQKLDLEMECDELRYEHDHLANTNSELKTKLSDNEKTLRELKGQLEGKSLDCDVAGQDLLAHKRENASLQKQIRKLQNDLDTANSQLNEFRRKSDVEQSELNQQATDAAASDSAKLKATADMVEDAQEEISILELECSQLKTQNANLTRKVEDLNATIERMTVESEDLRKNLHFLTEVVARPAFNAQDTMESNEADGMSSPRPDKSARRRSLAEELQADGMAHHRNPSMSSSHSRQASSGTAGLFNHNPRRRSSARMEQLEVGAAARRASDQTSSSHRSTNSMTELPPTAETNSQLPETSQDGSQKTETQDSTAKSTNDPSKVAALFDDSSKPRRHKVRQSTGGYLDKYLKDEPMVNSGMLPNDFNSSFKGDYLGLANNQELKQSLQYGGGNQDEQVLFTDSIREIRERIFTFGDVRSTNEKKHLLVLTSEALYRVRSHGWRVARRIPLDQLTCIHVSTKGAGLFIIKVADDVDCMLRSARWIELVGAIRRATYNKVKENLPFDFRDDIQVRTEDGIDVSPEVDVTTQAVYLRRTYIEPGGRERSATAV